ncbi:MAG: TRAP transporter large permease subunit [Desulfatiglans sp.]|nr:TRAP transporter large permease subunit [Thermodesulfobacteriota bacterium]MEE4352419.1 TRAP transporter large permease subunit [Desulfatiglans sp.]
MSATMIIIISISILLVLLMSGCPIFLCMGIAGGLGIFLYSGISGLSVLQTTVFGALSKFTLVAAPLFILMGEIIFKSGISKDLYEAFNRILRRVPGGIAIATVFASAIFGALCGISIAAVASIGVIALSEMLKRGYDPKLAAGAVCAPGALAMLIPPSLLFILYGEVAGVSVAKLFIAGILPGILLAGLMCLYILIRVIISSRGAARDTAEEALSSSGTKTINILIRLWAPVALITLVLGSIYIGIATPTESAALGVVGAYFIAFIVYRSLNWNSFLDTLANSARVTGTILMVFVGAVVFTQFLNILRVPDSFAQFVASLHVSPFVTMLSIQFMLLVLGMFVDGASMIMITTPILLPIVLSQNWNPIWFGVLMITNIEMAVITPPVGLNLYTLATVSDDVSMETILKGTLPYVLVIFLGLLILMTFPQISLWLPGLMR